MDKNQLITLAAKSKMLRNLAHKLCNYRYISDDLFQEFLIYLLERDEDFLIKKYLEVKFIFYCSCVIRGINGHRLAANKLTNTKNPLCEKQTHCELSGYEFEDNNYNFDIDHKYNEIINDKQSIYLTTSYTQLISETGHNYSKIHNLKTKAKNELKRKFSYT
jgi:hypothetical protein